LKSHNTFKLSPLKVFFNNFFDISGPVKFDEQQQYLWEVVCISFKIERRHSGGILLKLGAQRNA
jgi:hypothetical protein